MQGVRSSCLLVVLALAIASLVQAAPVYDVSASRLQNYPVISSRQHQSVFDYNYNAAWIEPHGDTPAGLLVRSQNHKHVTHGAPVTPSLMTFARQRDPTHFDYISKEQVVFQQDGTRAESYGVEDPRVVFDNVTGDYILMYSAVQANPIVSRLAMARSKTPHLAHTWRRYGPVFPDVHWSKSGALIIREHPPHLLFWGDKNISLAVSRDLYSFHHRPGHFITIRDDHFDSELVESGPPPHRLSDGNYLFIYNSARKVNHYNQYNVGFLILDGKDPSKILQRSEHPILSPELAWEIGTPEELHLVSHVVFLEAMYPDPHQKDSFIAYYGGADSVIGACRLTVTKHGY